MRQQFSLGIKHQLFNNEVRKRRLVLGLTQIQLAELCGIGKGTLAHIETFRAYPSVERATKIAKVLGSTVNQLFPRWIETFKDKRTSIITEHLLTERMLDHPELKLLPAETGNIEEVETAIDKDILKSKLNSVLETLSLREKKVLVLRFGLDENITESELKRLNGGVQSSHQGKTLEEVGNIFGVTRDRIRQIENQALRKLRHPSRAKLLKDFLR